MSWRNKYHVSIPELKRQYSEYVSELGDYAYQALSPVAQQLDVVFAHSNDIHYKIIHPLLIRSYRMPTFKFSETPLNIIGLDVETEHTTGMPMLFGFSYPSEKHSEGTYRSQYKPTVQSLFETVREICDHKKGYNLVTWGNLDIQVLLRLFNPTQEERQRISRGMGGRIIRGEIVGQPPILRYVKIRQRKAEIPFYVAHYIPGRSLKLGYVEAGREYIIWVFNASQFFPKRIADSARGYGMKWKDFPTDTHLIDWKRYSADADFRTRVNASNEQDARTVRELVGKLQDVFYHTFECYPTLLVSTGSLTDAAVSKMLSSSKEEYQSNSGKWLRENVWRNHASEETCSLLDVLTAESYSAGYVDQYSVGFFDIAYSADISSAYPHKIRALPDLRYSIIRSGSGNVEAAYKQAIQDGLDVEEIFIRGTVTIPESLRYHPITIKKMQRTNYRAIGTFVASYLWSEREYCVSHGATFVDADWVLLGLIKRLPAPIASVSIRFGELRDSLRKRMKGLDNSSPEWILLNNQQLLVKVVDNSIYGKTVMTTEVVEDIKGIPQITGYIAGDRFNMVYGAIITGRTRIQIADACMRVSTNGGTPIMVMTDAVYWCGNPDALPIELTRKEKTAGFFEPVGSVTELYVLKTGQYEYFHVGKYHYKLRGLPIQREIIEDAEFADGTLTGSESFLRAVIKEHCEKLPVGFPAKDVEITLPTRRLRSIGSQDISMLGAVVEGKTNIRPFVLSSKQTEKYLDSWRDALDGHVWLLPTVAGTNSDTSAMESPSLFFSEEYLAMSSDARATKRQIKREQLRKYRARASKEHLQRGRTKDIANMRQKKKQFIAYMVIIHHIIPPADRPYNMSWSELESWFGHSRAEYDLWASVGTLFDRKESKDA